MMLAQSAMTSLTVTLDSGFLRISFLSEAAIVCLVLKDETRHFTCPPPFSLIISVFPAHFSVQIQTNVWQIMPIFRAGRTGPPLDGQSPVSGFQAKHGKSTVFHPELLRYDEGGSGARVHRREPERRKDHAGILYSAQNTHG